MWDGLNHFDDGKEVARAIINGGGGGGGGGGEIT